MGVQFLLGMVRWMAARQAAGVAFALIAQAVLNALAPLPVVFLVNHDHVVVGSVTAEDWRAHVQLHLRLAGSHYFSAAQPRLPIPPDRPRIMSLPCRDYDALGVSTRAPVAAPPMHEVDANYFLVSIGLVHLPRVIDLSPDLAPACPPPKPTAL
ncbi:MAG: hypothetical protein RMN25_05395 [Anaerolineae bacterium]|nr:hypothetical protein [Thermoflexales bacterium]MDW8407201.1 hypothetical protein [Anaerolineae bacterium]